MLDGKEIAITQNREQLITVLQNSLYVGAKRESVEMVLSYCEAARLDPMQKPAHIVPMNTKNPVTNNYEWRDVVMPGVGLYRIQADRSGTMAGISAPEFGPEITQTFTDKNGSTVEVTFPEWCRITAKKVVGAHIVEFTAMEYWLENYATDSGKSSAPNAMWRKRPRGQIAKCAEAQVLRKGWPEIGQAPTAEEMEGKVIDINEPPKQQIQTQTPKRDICPDELFQKSLEKARFAIADNQTTAAEIIQKMSTRYELSMDQHAQIMELEA